MAESFFSKIVERAGAVFDQIANEYIVFDNLVCPNYFLWINVSLTITLARRSKRHPQAPGD
jgi:hypothetical protein